MPKLIPIRLELPIGENTTQDDLKTIINAFEASLRRCCNSCDEPLQLLKLIKENRYLYENKK